jgi:hypothetical protein
MTKYTSDQDGKSKTASAVDQTHYPEQNEVKNSPQYQEPILTHQHIAERAYELWEARGCPHGSPELDWIQAEEELRDSLRSNDLLERTTRQSGSVQR